MDGGQASLAEVNAGPLTDDLVAERVMGWQRKWVLAKSPGVFWGGLYATKLECTNYQRRSGIDRDYHSTLVWAEGDRIAAWREEWKPSTDVGVAMQAVEHVQGLPCLGIGFDLHSRGDVKVHREKWTAEMSMPGLYRRQEWCGHGGTAALAICRALLEWAVFLTER